MQATASRLSNKWLQRSGELKDTLAKTLPTQGQRQTGESRPGKESPTKSELLFSVGEGHRLTSRQLKDLLETPDDQSDAIQLKMTALALIEQAKAAQKQVKTEQQEELGVSSFSQTVQTRVDQAKYRREALMQEQEALRTEILELNARIGKLETLKSSVIPGDQRPKKHSPTINKRKLKPGQVEKELLEMGVKRQLSVTEKITENDQEVQATNLELLRRQRLAIDEMSKYDLLPLKKPQFVLLMDRLSRIREPNEPHELKLLKKAIKNVNLLYAKINEVDLEVASHRLVYGQRVQELQAENQDLADRIRETRDHINKMNVHQAFKESDLQHMKATEFLEANPVPYNFAQIIRDYKLLDVFGEGQK